MEASIRQEQKNFIITEALRLGFSHIGFTSPNPHKYRAVYQQWIKTNQHAGMDYLSRPDRLEKINDPSKILSTCKTMIVFALPYHPAKPLLETDKNDTGQVASYAVSKDYHIIIPELLESIIRKFQIEYPNTLIDYKIYTDTGPIMEKAYAQEAGIGWIGKNSCLIIPGFGSYVFLAEILINLDLPKDEPFQNDLCGNCQACLQTCPTGCINDNRTINANHCISYQTIENKSDIPTDLRDRISHWVFGCDICQLVCPWNKRFCKAPLHTHFEPINNFPWVKLNKIVPLTPQEFNKKFKDHPIKRSKRRGYYRNICIVMGNTQSESYIPFLIELIKQETEPLILEHALWAIKKISFVTYQYILEEYKEKLSDQEILEN